jgi:hypothetical protein
MEARETTAKRAGYSRFWGWECQWRKKGQNPSGKLSHCQQEQPSRQLLKARGHAQFVQQRFANGLRLPEASDRRGDFWCGGYNNAGNITYDETLFS